MLPLHKIDDLLEVCEEMDLEVDYLSLKERGAFAFPMKETIRAFKMSEDDPKTVTIVRDKDDFANMNILYNRRLHGESVLSAPEQDCEGVNGLRFCNGVVHSVELCEVGLRVEGLLPALCYN